MSSSAFQPPARMGKRLCISVLVVFALQVGIIYWLGDRTPIGPRRTGRTPALNLLEGETAYALETRNPTLFALPNRHCFSGEAWLREPTWQYDLPAWSEPPRLLTLHAAELGSVFVRRSFTNSSPAAALAQLPMPALTAPTITYPDVPLGGASRLELGGELLSRLLLQPPELPLWPHTELLTNTVVQVMVDAVGRVVSSVLLHSSGKAEADKHALEFARAARFEILEDSGTAPSLENLQWGQLIFHWQTVPAVAVTNAPTGR